MARKQGRLGKLYGMAESTYGTAPSIGSANAIRHLEFTLTDQPYNRVDSRERSAASSLLKRFARREAAEWNLAEAYMYPSGTIGTAPELSPILKNGMGVEVLGTGNTTLTAGATTTGGTLTSATGFAIGQFVLITVGTTKYVRKVTNLVTTTITWAPALPSAPATSAPIKSGVAYNLATDIPASVFFAKYLNDSFSEFCYGAVVNTMKLMFDANDEVRFAASGPCQKVRTSGGPAIPGGFTTVGGDPPSGLTGSLFIGGTQFEFIKAEIEIQNNARLVGGDSFGAVLPTGFARNQRRRVTINLEAELDDVANLLAKTEAGTFTDVLIQCGTTEGAVWAAYLPSVDFARPEIPDADEYLVTPYSGVAMGSAGNDEISIGAC